MHCFTCYTEHNKMVPTKTIEVFIQEKYYGYHEHTFFKFYLPAHSLGLNPVKVINEQSINCSLKRDSNLRLPTKSPMP